MVNAIVSWILGFILKVFDYVLGFILAIFSGLNLNDGFYSIVYNASNALNNFWGYMIRDFMLVRSFLDINTFEMGLIVELLTVTILHRPLILVGKLFIRWYKNLKL